MFTFKNLSTRFSTQNFSFGFAAFAFVIFSIFAFSPTAANAQKEKTITKKVVFAKGKSSTVIRGTAQAYTYYAFTVSAKKNQFIIVDVNSPNENVYVSVFEPGALESLNDPEKDVSGYSGDILKTGVYKVLIYTKSDAGASPFVLGIKIN